MSKKEPPKLTPEQLTRIAELAAIAMSPKDIQRRLGLSDEQMNMPDAVEALESGRAEGAEEIGKTIQQQARKDGGRAAMVLGRELRRQQIEEAPAPSAAVAMQPIDFDDLMRRMKEVISFWAAGFMRDRERQILAGEIRPDPHMDSASMRARFGFGPIDMEAVER